MSTVEPAVKQERRFAFGQNWQRFLAAVDEERIAEAEKSLKTMLAVENLHGKRFLDIGSGSGLFSLAARRLGARVHSFDYDPQSAACTAELKRRYLPGDPGWTIEEGSVLDADYLRSLGQFDVVYAWGVLHHTGALWQALENAQVPVAPGGQLFIAIYNHQPFWSAFWHDVKRFYNGAPGFIRTLMNGSYYLLMIAGFSGADLLRGRNPLDRHRGRNRRGMNVYRDVVDWLGGWPFEVATPEEIFRFYRDAGFTLVELKTCAGKSGCNQFVFRKPCSASFS